MKLCEELKNVFLKKITVDSRNPYRIRLECRERKSIWLKETQCTHWNR